MHASDWSASCHDAISASVAHLGVSQPVKRLPHGRLRRGRRRLAIADGAEDAASAKHGDGTGTERRADPVCNQAFGHRWPIREAVRAAVLAEHAPTGVRDHAVGDFAEMMRPEPGGRRRARSRISWPSGLAATARLLTPDTRRSYRLTEYVSFATSDRLDRFLYTPAVYCVSL